MRSRERALDSLITMSDGSAFGSRQELMDRVLDVALSIADADGASIQFPHPSRGVRRTLVDARGTLETQPVAQAEVEFARLVLRGTRPVSVRDLSADPPTPEAPCPGLDAGPALFVPLKLRDHAPGSLAVYRARGRAPFDAEDARLAQMLGAWTAVALDHVRLTEMVGRLAITDDLTQVYNYRFLKTALRREIKRASRSRQPLALVMMDVDNLKGYNDKNGHTRGSRLLREIARLCSRQVRAFDLLAKYGGDEFTLILPQTGRDGACVVAERMRAAIAGHTFALAEPGAITVSSGVAVFPEDGADPFTLIQAADRALYLAKKRGRNRVEPGLAAAA